MMLEKKKDVRKTFISLVAVTLFLALVLVLDQVIKPSNKMYMLLTVLQKGSVYALAAVSMNLLNGFTGLFSLGHAGFMVIGAYTYAIFSIPAASRDTVYQYYDAAIRISFPEVLGNALGGFGTVLGVILCVLLAGLVASLFAYLIGLPVGLILRMTDRDGIHPIGWLNRTLGIIVNALRSIPFIILMVAMLPVAKAIVGTSLGNRAVIVTLVIAAAPYVARMVESAAKEVDAGVIEAALSMGASTFRIIWKVIIPEAKPALITGAVISTVTILGYSAMAGTIGGGGLGQIAITYGYQKYDDQIVWLCVALTIIIVQILQEFGMYIARRTDRRSRT